MPGLECAGVAGHDRGDAAATAAAVGAQDHGAAAAHFLRDVAAVELEDLTIAHVVVPVLRVGYAEEAGGARGHEVEAGIRTADEVAELTRGSAADGGLDVGDEFGQLGDVSGTMPRLKGLSIDAAGHLWVSDAWLDQVSLYTRDGDLLMSLGGAGAAPGRFNFPAGIAAHVDGRVAVVDAQNRRVQVFDLLDVPEEP